MKRFIVIICTTFCFCSSSHSTNVIIIAVDTLRADHLGCYGYPRNTSPNIDKFATDAVKFNSCYTPSPLTTPAFASMLSSLPPFRHGAKRNGLSIFDNVKILPEFLKKYEYYSGAFISTNVLRKNLCRLDRGFNTYSEVLNKRRLIGRLKAEGKAPKVNEAVFKWLDQNSRKKFFLWIHYIEPHEPYVYHREFDSGFNKVILSAYPEGSNFRKIKKYDTEIGYVDSYIGELIEKLKKLELYEESLIIFMADHGESFGEHNYYRHGRKLYNSCLHVPLLVKLPGNRNASSVIDKNVSILDIAPTILSLLGCPVPEEMEGKNLFDPGRERVLYFEAYKGRVLVGNRKNFKIKAKPIRYGLLKDNIKLIFHNGFEAYNIKKDKFELNNIYKNPDREMKVMSELLRKYIIKVQQFIKYSKKYLKQKSKLSKEDLEKLESLGYIHNKK